MTPDPATFTGLKEISRKNKLDLHGWRWIADIEPCGSTDGWWEHDDGRMADEATPTDLAAVCFEVARWLRDEYGIAVCPVGEGWEKFRVHEGWKSSAKEIIADNEPAALLAACKEINS